MNLKKYFNFRIDEQTKLKLDILAKVLHRTRSNLVRHLILKEFQYQKLNAQNAGDAKILSEIDDASIAFITNEKGD